MRLLFATLLLSSFAYAGEHTGDIYVNEEDVTWCIYRPDPGNNDDHPYAIRFHGKVDCPDYYNDEKVHGDTQRDIHR